MNYGDNYQKLNLTELYIFFEDAAPHFDQQYLFSSRYPKLTLINDQQFIFSFNIIILLKDILKN